MGTEIILKGSGYPPTSGHKQHSLSGAFRSLFPVEGIDFHLPDSADLLAVDNSRGVLLAVHKELSNYGLNDLPNISLDFFL